MMAGLIAHWRKHYAEKKKKKNENEEFDNQVFRPIALLEIP